MGHLLSDRDHLCDTGAQGDLLPRGPVVAQRHREGPAIRRARRGHARRGRSRRGGGWGGGEAVGRVAAHVVVEEVEERREGLEHLWCGGAGVVRQA